MRSTSRPYNRPAGGAPTNDKALKQIYRTLSKTYHPDGPKGDMEIMQVVNQLKQQWGL